MEIIVIESYDSELGYDEEKYYEINNYKNMVVYAQKNKQHKGLSGITLDFNSLIEDLKKKRILIKSEFENIKESDLGKHYDYYILPDDFINDIIVQLGYEPSKKRTYKNNEVEYLGEVISDREFEQIIADEKHEFYWLSKTIFENAQIEIITQINGNVQLVFIDGIWKKGTWETGRFIKSIWQDGTWIDGYFKYSTWEKGNWEKGIFYKSTWEYGIWGDGEFRYESTWIDGTWEKGFFNNSTWEKGTWEDGIFEDSIWLDGNWEDGLFTRSIWKKGKWEKGKWVISKLTKCGNTKEFNPKSIKYVLSYNEYTFEQIWEDSELLLEIVINEIDGSNTIHIGNFLLTKKQIEQRIKEIS